MFYFFSLFLFDRFFVVRAVFPSVLPLHFRIYRRKISLYAHPILLFFFLSISTFSIHILYVHNFLISHLAFFQPFRVRVSFASSLFLSHLSPISTSSFLFFLHMRIRRPFSASFLFFRRDAFSLLPNALSHSERVQRGVVAHVIICIRTRVCRRRLRRAAPVRKT